MNDVPNIYSSPTFEAALPNTQASSSVVSPLQEPGIDAISADSIDATAILAKVEPDTIKLNITESPALRQTYGWKTREVTLAQFERRLSTHRSLVNKDESALFVPGLVQGDRRTINAVSELSALVLDLDKGEDLEAIRSGIRTKGLYAIVYSTHSHNATETEVRLDDYRKFSGGNDLSVDELRRYLLEVREFLPWIVETLEIADSYRDTCNGAVCVARHAPLPKYRLVFPLRIPFRRRDYVANGGTQAQFEAAWKAKYAAVASSLAIRWDQTCTDVSRAFFYPSCKPGADSFTEKFEGQLLDLNDIEVDLPSSAPTRKGRHAQTLTFEDFDLLTWIAKYGSTFQIEMALRSRAPSDIFRSARSSGAGVHITCPFEKTHSRSGGTGTFVVNAGDNEESGFGIHCCHEHCLSERGNGTSVDRLPFIKKMLEDGWLTRDDLQNPEFGGGGLSDHVNAGHRFACCDLRVVDRTGRGIDAAIFHASMIAKPDRFDFDQLNALCQTQIAADVTAEQIAGFIETGRVAVAHLIECSHVNQAETNDDPYTSRLRELARKKSAGSLLGHQIDEQLEVIRIAQKVKQKTIESDFKILEREVKSPKFEAELGVLSAEDAALVKPFRDYVRDFAIINTGGKGVVMALGQPEISKAIMQFDDFDKLYRNEWIEVVADDGSKNTIFPARQFLAKPPKNARVFHGGFVFRPSGTVPADEYNLYRGMLVKPDPSGSYSLLHDLIRDVWTQDNGQATQWVMEWLMHIAAHPGERVGTSIAIRGGYGDGKSIVFEKLMGSILGDMMLRVANHKMILGDFNEALIGKLVTVLEEAAFAGDKAAFDKMKELITGEKVLINPKFKAPVTVDNFSRLVVISNNDHFLHIKPGDRRYTVLESSPAWRGTNKFEQLLDQWANGGAARFVYDALNHSFQRFDDHKKLAIATNLKTTAAVRRMALSRSSLEKCVVDIILRGDFTTQRGSDVHVFESGGFRTLKSWELDKPFDISSLDLERFVKSWLADFDSSAGRHEATLHTIIETLGRYIGETEIYRPKGAADPATGKRPQAATRRLLPTRRKALEHAWSVGLITQEECESALPVTTAEAAQDFKFSTEASSAVDVSRGLAAANDQFLEFRTRSNVR